MNIIDLIVALILIFAIYNGWKSGFIMQLCSLIGIVAGVYLSATYGATVGNWLKMDESIAAAGGFVVILIVTIIAVAIIARIIKKIFHFAGFGVPDIALGIIVSLAKYILLLSVLLSALNKIDIDNRFTSNKTVETSRTYKPLIELSEHISPAFKWIEDKIPKED